MVSDILIDQNSRIVLDVFNEVAGIELRINVRISDSNGKEVTSRFRVNPSSDSLKSKHVFKVGFGVLKSVTVFTETSNVGPGQCFVNGYMTRGDPTNSEIFESLFSGYLQNQRPLSSNQNIYDGPMSGDGNNVVVFPASPGIGLSFDFNVPINHFLLLNSFTFKVTADSTVGSRSILFQMFISGNMLYSIAASETLRANDINFYRYFSKVGTPNRAVEGITPHDGAVLMDDADFIRISISNVFPGDQISDIGLNFRTWIDVG